MQKRLQARQIGGRQAWCSVAPTGARGCKKVCAAAHEGWSGLWGVTGGDLVGEVGHVGAWCWERILDRRPIRARGHAGGEGCVSEWAAASRVSLQGHHFCVRPTLHLTLSFPHLPSKTLVDALALCGSFSPPA